MYEAATLMAMARRGIVLPKVQHSLRGSASSARKVSQPYATR